MALSGFTAGGLCFIHRCMSHSNLGHKASYYAIEIPQIIAGNGINHQSLHTVLSIDL